MQRVLGHDDAKRRFARTLERGRLASTYLLVGPRGVGKRLFAERLAAALLCQRPGADPLVACGQCEACGLTDAGTHPDLLRVEKPEGKSSLPVDLFLGPPDKRNRMGLCHDIALKPFLGRRRIAIIDDADDFGVESANCLLKTLEEPPPGSLLLLIGTSLARQLPTIRSRSQVIRFSGLSDEQVAHVLQREPHAASAEEAGRLAAQSDGSVGRALLLADEAVGGARDAIRECLDAARIDPLRLARVMDEQSKAGGTEPRLRRRALAEMLAAAIETLRGRLLAAVGDATTADPQVGVLDACLEAEEALHRNANQSALVQRLAERLARLAG